MSEAFFQKHKKKGLAGLLLLLFGGAKRDALLVVIVGVAAVLAVGMAAVTGKLNLTGRPAAAKTADGTALETDAELEAKAKAEAEGKLPGQIFEEVQQAKMELASSRGVLPIGVPGKAKSERNDAVNYIGRDKKVIGDAEAQEKLAEASAGRPVDGVPLGEGNGFAGQRGMGSLGMSAAGDSASSGATYNVQNDKDRLYDSMSKKANKTPPPKGGGGGGGAGNRGYKGNKLTGYNRSALNTHLISGGKKSSVTKKGKFGKAMWQLVNAAAMTMTSLCPNCRKESTALYNRAYATGEAVGGAGIIALPGDAEVAIDPSKMDAMMNSFGTGAAGVGDASAECKEKMEKNNAAIQSLGKKMTGLKWDDGLLDQVPDKCCKVKNYNEKVNEYKGYCADYNKRNAESNKACGTPENQGAQDCGRYKEQETCGWFKCWFLFILICVLTGVVVFVAPVMLGMAAGYGAFGAMASVGAMGVGVAALQLFAPNEVPH